MKKNLAALLIIILLGTIWTGCSNKIAVVDETPQSTETEHIVDNALTGKLVIWEHTAEFEKPLIRIIEGFQKKYPNVEIEYEIKYENYYNVLATAIQAGEAPDLFWTNGTATPQMKKYVEEDALYELTDIVDYSDLEAESLAIATIGEKRYSVPWMSFDTRACYYNKDMFEQMGLTVPKTFEEFEKLLETIKENGKIPISLAGSSTWEILFFLEPLMAAMEPEYTRSLSTYKSQAAAPNVGNVLNKALEWADKGYFGDGYMWVDGRDGQNLAFTMEDAAMTVSGSWFITAFQENNPQLNFGAFQIPTREGTSAMVGVYANGFSMYKGTRNEAAALAFMNYCASLEAQTYWVQTLGAVSGSDKIESTNEIAKEISDCDETFTSWQFVLSQYTKEGVSATSIWEEDSVRLFGKLVTVDDLLKDIQSAMQ